MIPFTAGDLDEVAREVRRQTSEAETLTDPVTPAGLTWRPGPDRWSVAGHLAHLSIVNGPYQEAVRRALQDGRSGGRLSDGPYRHPWFGRWFAASMEPPPRRRWRTARAMVPDPEVQGVDALSAFRACQDELAALVAESRGLDLGRLRISSPFMRLLRFSVGAAFGILLAHNRRHLWLIREVMDQEAFPG